MYSSLLHSRFLIHSSNKHVYLHLRGTSVSPFFHSVFNSFNFKGCGCQRSQFSSVPVDRPSIKKKKKLKSELTDTSFSNTVNVSKEKELDSSAKLETLSNVTLNKYNHVFTIASDYNSSKCESDTLVEMLDGESGSVDSDDIFFKLMSSDNDLAFIEEKELEEIDHIAEVSPLETSETSTPEVKSKKKTKSKKNEENKESKGKKIGKKKEKENNLNEQEKLYLQLRKEGKNYAFNKTLTTYLSVCNFSGHHDAAFKTFLHFTKISSTKKSGKEVKIITYNQILKDLACERNLKNVERVILIMTENKVKPEPATFGYILTCLGHQENSESNRKRICEIFEWMEKENICLKDVLTSTTFPGDQIKFFREAVERVKKGHDITLTELNSSAENFISDNQYDNVLTNSLNEFIFTNKVNSPAQGVVSQDQCLSVMNAQIEQEVKCYVHIPSVVNLEETPEDKCYMDLLADWEKSWRESLLSSIVAQKKYMKKKFIHQYVDAVNLYPYFNLFSDKELVELLIMEIHRIYKMCNGSELYSISLKYLANTLGLEVYNQFILKYKQETGLLRSIRKVYGKYCSWYLDMSQPGSSYIPRIQWKKIALEEGCEYSLSDHPPDWPQSVTLPIGHLLYNTLLTNIMIWHPGGDKDSAFPAFYKVIHSQKAKSMIELRPAPLLMNVHKVASAKRLIFPSNTLPMVAPPVPWTTTNSGCFMLFKTDFVRLVNYAYLQKQRIKDSGNQSLFPIMDSLNQLGNIPWKINTNILDILIKIFNNNGWVDLDIPPPSSMCLKPPKIHKSMSANEKIKLREARVNYDKKRLEMHSRWCDMHYKLSLANYFRDNVFWLPHNVDFRGRTYPISPHLTHHLSDALRAIMLFAQGQKLGAEGLFWLKLHLINLTGMKKRHCIQDRLDYCEEVMDEIFDSADNPLDGRQWWIKSDEPWQTLAACMELAAAIRSGNPEEYVSYFPIHQDGSCNGLQHYAALGRDVAGAHSVNLTPSAVPQDVYSEVALLVEEKRKQDAENGLPIAQALEGCIKRKIIKQTVMTTVYGVTRYGAIQQILKQLYAHDFDESLCPRASSYLTKKTFESLGQMFSSAHEIQNWFRKCAEGISKHCLEKIEWVTPLGFPIVQFYSQLKRTDNTILGKISHDFMSDSYLKPNVMKQKNAFPPNFIHSLDSSHMMLTSLFSQHAGITFVSIHDCFWTHAAAVPVMNEICRKQFVSLHSQPIMEELSEFLNKKMSSHASYNLPFTVWHNHANEDIVNASLADLFTYVPVRGKFDIREVMKSVFFFS